MKCECLFCDSKAVARLTVPQHKPRTLMCEGHMERQIAWAEPYRDHPGMVVVEAL